MSGTARYAAMAAACLVLTMAALVVGGGGSYILVLFGVLLAFVFAGFAYDSRFPPDPLEPSSK